MAIPEYLDPVIRHAAARWNIDENYLRAVLMTESRGNVNTPDSVIIKNGVRLPGAGGIAQIIPDTARRLGVDRYNPYQAIDGSAHLLSMGLADAEKAGMSPSEAAAAALRYYNSGSLYGKTDPGYVQKTTNYYYDELKTADKRANTPSLEYSPPPAIESAASTQNLDPRWLHAAAIARGVNINNPDAIGSLAANLNKQLSDAEARKAGGEAVDPAAWAAQQVGISSDLINRHYSSFGVAGLPSPKQPANQAVAATGAAPTQPTSTVAALRMPQWLPLGDSLAGGFARFGGLGGEVVTPPPGETNTTAPRVNGRNPQDNLTYLKSLPDGSLNGQPVLWSSGLSNSGDPGNDIGLVPQQLGELRRAGAGPIALVGVGTRAGYEGRNYFDLNRYNPQLEDIATNSGAIPLGGIPNAVVHPLPGYYKPALGRLGAPPPASAPEASSSVPDLKGVGAAPPAAALPPELQAFADAMPGGVNVPSILAPSLVGRGDMAAPAAPPDDQTMPPAPVPGPDLSWRSLLNLGGGGG